MDIRNTVKLVTLSAIWGGSFIFMRVLSPVLGPVLTASMRTFVAGVFLMIVFRMTNYKIHWKRDFRHLLIIGIVNSSIPFYMYAYAALHIEASMSSILNSLAPMFGAIFSAVFMIERLNLRKGMGLILGTIGVGMVTSLNTSGTGTGYYLSIGACILAAMCYGLGSAYIKSRASHLEAKAIAVGSQLFAGIALLPFVVIMPPTGKVTLGIVGMVIAFAVVCSALAYLLYYDLIANIGPTKALTVTYLIPVTAIVWGMFLLGERITVQTVVGGIVILAGTYMVNGSKISKNDFTAKSVKQLTQETE